MTMENELTSYEVRLEVFEGPLDLLLHLIKKNEINICDIPIALITQQYLHYIGLMKHLNLDVAGEFLVMAATLTQIKSRMLLPKEVMAEEQEAEDPRAELVRRLIDYQRYRDASRMLEDRETHWRDVFLREPSIDLVAEVMEVQPMLPLDIGLFDLIDALQKVLERLPSTQVLEFKTEEFSIKDKMAFILDRMGESEGLDFGFLFENDRTARSVIVTFLALLELVKMRLVTVVQDDPLGPIRLSRPALCEGESLEEG